MEERGRIRSNGSGADAVFPQAGAAGFIGVLVLDTQFPRLPGDVGHPGAFGGRARHRVVNGARPSGVVTAEAPLRASGLAAGFVREARALQAQGATAITTSCGFLVLFQDELQAAVQVPVVTSSLLQLPALLASEQRVGVLTIDASNLGPGHLRCAGVPPGRLQDVVVQGVDPAGAFARGILSDDPRMDMAAAGADVVAAACALRERAPGLRVAVLECTNMPPHAGAATAASGLRLLALGDDPRLRPL